jgi:DNA-binding XRE family transcriptional regulator
MPETTPVDASATRVDVPVRLRVEVYDVLAAAKGYRSVEAQAKWHGLNRGTLFDLRAGNTQPRLDTAMRMAADLGVAVEVIFERAA